MSNHKVVVAIDFGSSGSGFAFSFNDENRVIQGIIKGGNVNNKVPTEIILEKKNDEDEFIVVEWGAQCSKYLKKRKDFNIHYFKDIKMNLYEHKKWISSQNSDLQLPIVFVIQKFLEEIKKVAFQKIREIQIGINEKDIKWVVTVPAIWNDYEKSIMMEACIKANLVDENSDKSLFFALEPEAASIYCSRNKEIEKKFFEEGKYYIICDLGGGTGDIVTHLIGENQKLEEIESATGGNYGSNEINKKILKDIIFKIFGIDNFNEFYKIYKTMREKKKNKFENLGTVYYEWHELERQINDFKEDTTLENVEDNDTFPLNLSLFKDIYGEEEDIEQLINRYNLLCTKEELKLEVSSKEKWIVNFPYKIMNTYIQEQVDSICKAIKGILLSTSKKKIDTIILVGGYCDNDLLISSIEKNLPEINYFLKPTYPCLAVMQGAVLFGLRSDIINIRKAKYTIGVNTTQIWDKEKHGYDVKTFYDEDNILRVSNCFRKFIEKGQNLEYGTIIKKKFHMLGPKVVKFEVYKTEKLNPEYITEEGMIKIGQLILDTGRINPKVERDLEGSMKFGGTYLEFKSKHLKSGKEINTILKFV